MIKINKFIGFAVILLFYNICFLNILCHNSLFSQTPEYNITILNNQEANLSEDFADELNIYVIIDGKEKLLGKINKDTGEIKSKLPEGIYILKIEAYDAKHLYDDKPVGVLHAVTKAKYYNYRIHRVFFIGLEIKRDAVSLVLPKLYSTIKIAQGIRIKSSLPVIVHIELKKTWQQYSNNWVEKNKGKYYDYFSENYKDEEDRIVIEIRKKESNKIYRLFELNKSAMTITRVKN